MSDDIFNGYSLLNIVGKYFYNTLKLLIGSKELYFPDAPFLESELNQLSVKPTSFPVINKDTFKQFFVPGASIGIDHNFPTYIYGYGI